MVSDDIRVIAVCCAHDANRVPLKIFVNQKTVRAKPHLVPTIADHNVLPKTE